MKKNKNNSIKLNKTKPINSSVAKYLFDDCPICQAEKDAIKRGKPLNMSELKNAFKHANGRNFQK